MKNQKLVSVKVTESTRQMLRVLAAHYDVNVYEVAEAQSRADIIKNRLKLPKKDKSNG